jgi:lipoprotein LprG
MTGRARLAALVTVVALLSGGCSSSDEPTTTPRQALAAAKRNLDATSGVRIGLVTPKLPSGVNGLLEAHGVGTHDPAFEGTIKVSARGITADADVVAVDHKVYAKLPFTTRFTPIDPDDYGAPDPAHLLADEGGLSSLLTAATGVERGDQVRDGKVVLSSYRAKVPGKAVASVIPSAAADGTFAAVFTVTDDDLLARTVLSGPFYPDADDVTYTISFEDYGTKRTITAP